MPAEKHLNCRQTHVRYYTTWKLMCMPAQRSNYAIKIRRMRSVELQYIIWIKISELTTAICSTYVQNKWNYVVSNQPNTFSGYLQVAHQCQTSKKKSYTIQYTFHLFSRRKIFRTNSIFFSRFGWHRKAKQKNNGEEKMRRI